MFNKAEAGGMRRKNAVRKSHCSGGRHLLTLCSMAGTNPSNGALTNQTREGAPTCGPNAPKMLLRRYTEIIIGL